MDNLYVSAAIVACIFLLAKFIEMRFISPQTNEDSEKTKPMKSALQNAGIVFISYILGHFIISQFSNSPVVLGTKPDVFTGAPGF
jgi:hypothetical protein